MKEEILPKGSLIFINEKLCVVTETVNALFIKNLNDMQKPPSPIKLYRFPSNSKENPLKKIGPAFITIYFIIEEKDRVVVFNEIAEK